MAAPQPAGCAPDEAGIHGLATVATVTLPWGVFSSRDLTPRGEFPG